jgi:hypothetical protein
METKKVIINLPLALRRLILMSNEQLKEYQAKLLNDIEEASSQMMEILSLDPKNGWLLDLERMAYVRQVSVEEDAATTAEVKTSPKK